MLINYWKRNKEYKKVTSSWFFLSTLIFPYTLMLWGLHMSA